jgi:hypothetical protein
MRGPRDLGALAALGLVAALLSAPAAPAEAAAAPARLQVGAHEFGLTLSRARVPAGKVRIELVNYGEDPHDLKLRRVRGTRVHSLPEALPGGVVSRKLKLRAGRYKVWCSVADHRKLGMRARLRVVRR